MKMHKFLFILSLPLLFVLNSCEDQFKNWSPKKIEAYISEHFPVGTDAVGPENWTT